MNVDSHQHFWKYEPTRDTWITEAMSALKRDFLPEQLTIDLDANGIDASIAVQADQSENETLFLLDLAQRKARVAGVVGWVDLISPQIDQRLRFFSKFDKLCGFRHIAQAEPDDRFLVRPDFLAGISRLREFGFTYDILVYPRQIAAAAELVSGFPEQRFVIDHIAKPEIKTHNDGAWSANIRAIARNSNAYCKLSGLVTEADWHSWKPDDFQFYLDVVFEAFGPERLMFGSDWPVCLLAASYGQVKRLIEDYVDRYWPNEKGKIFGSNAIHFYGLKVPAHGSAN